MRRGGQAKLQEAESSNPCTEDEVSAMAEYLEVTPEDPSVVRDVARMAINAPLPPGWEDISDEATGEAAFKNFESGEVVDQHPLDDYFFELVRRRRAAVRKVSCLCGHVQPSCPQLAATRFMRREGFQSCAHGLHRSNMSRLLGTWDHRRDSALRLLIGSRSRKHREEQMLCKQMSPPPRTYHSGWRLLSSPLRDRKLQPRSSFPCQRRLTAWMRLKPRSDS